MEKRKEILKDIFAIAFIALLSSLPLVLGGIDGMIHQDLQFHLSRIEGIKEGLKGGQFPVMMQSVWMHGKGYPVSIFYGDALLYFPALLRLTGVGVTAAYKIFVFAINILTALSAVVCFKKITGSAAASYIGALIYVTASYRMMDIYVRAAVGEYSAFIFFPVIALAMVNILKKDKEERKLGRDDLLLALGMTGLIESHLLSTVMTVFLLAVVCVLFAKRTFRVNSLLTIGLAVVETIVLNLYFFVPFLDYYINEPVYAGKGGDHTQALEIRSSGAYVSQFFDFFGHIFGQNIEDASLRMQLTPGLAALIALAVCFVVVVVFRRKYKYFALGFMAVLTLVMSTNLFPWNSLEGYTHLFKILARVQFPWRYLAAAVFFVSLLTAMLIADFTDTAGAADGADASGDSGNVGKKKYVIPAIMLVTAVVCIVMTTVFTTRYKEGYRRVDFKNYDEVDSGYMGACEYLKEGTELIISDYVPENPQIEAYEVKKLKDSKIVMYVSNPGEESFVEVPKLNYKGYRARDEHKNRLTIRNGYLNLINVVVPAGFEGEIEVYFKQPAYWVAATVISALAWVWLIYLSFSYSAKKRTLRKDSIPRNSCVSGKK